MTIIPNRHLPVKGFHALNLFGIVFVRRDAWQKTTPQERRTMLRHEAIHTAQMRELGYIGFYLFYVLEWICREELVNPIRILLWNGMEKEAITFMFTSILKNREFYSHVVKLEGQNSFESIVKNCFTEALVEYITGHADSEKRKYKEMRPEWLAEFYSQGMSFVLISWIKGGMVEEPAEMVEMYEFIASHSMVDLPKEL